MKPFGVDPYMETGHHGIVDWHFDDAVVPRNGFDELTFPIKVRRDVERVGWFFAHQFAFVGEQGLPHSRDYAYAGIIPTRVNEAETRFSVFADGAEPQYPDLCHPGADYWPGVTCGQVVPEFKLNHYYLLRVFRDPDWRRVWRGHIRQQYGYKTIDMGAWSVQTDQGLHPSGLSWMEHYYVDRKCEDILRAEVQFMQPRHDPSGAKATFGTPWEGDRCRGRLNWAWYRHATYIGDIEMQSGHVRSAFGDGPRDGEDCGCDGRSRNSVNVNINVNVDGRTTGGASERETT